MQQLTTDVLVIGSGGAGLRAAIEARTCGASVLVLDKKKPGLASTTYWAASDWMAFGAAVGHADPADSPEQHYLDICAKGGLVSDPELSRIVAYEAPDRVEDLTRWGMDWDREPDGRYRQILSDGATYPRALGKGAETGKHLVEVLLERAAQLGCMVLGGWRLADLLADEKGVLALCLSASQEDWLLVRAKAAVIASGGMGALFAANIFPQGLFGEATIAALSAGAKLVNMEFIQIGPGSMWPMKFALSGVFWRLAPQITNGLGEEFLGRYMPEGVDLAQALWVKGVSYPYTVRNESQYVDRAIFHELAEGRGAEHGGVFLSLAHNPPEVIETEARVPFEFWLKHGVDLRRDALEFAPCCQHFNGGLLIDSTASVGVPGLYAAGEAAGGPHGADRPGGNALADCQVFGRIAGNSAADWASVHPLPGEQSALDWAEERQQAVLTRVNEQNSGEQEKAQLAKELWLHCGLYRDAAGLQSVLSSCEATRASLVQKGARCPGEVLELGR